MISTNQWPTTTSAKKKSAKKQSQQVVISEFLEATGRKLHPVKGDGNCLFRVLSYALLGDEDHNFLMRSSIVRLVNLNEKVFANYLIDGVNCSTVKQQVQHMMKPSSWGTHMEIVAAATLFRIPVYYCTQSTPGQFTWGVFHPIAADRISFPVFTEDLLMNPFTTSHIEMYYHSSDGGSAHYDAIVSLQTGTMCVTPPQLTGTIDPNVVAV